MKTLVKLRELKTEFVKINFTNNTDKLQSELKELTKSSC